MMQNLINPAAKLEMHASNSLIHFYLEPNRCQKLVTRNAKILKRMLLKQVISTQSGNYFKVNMLHMVVGGADHCHVLVIY